MKVFKITFNTDEEAREEEFEIRDNMGSLVDTAIEGDTVYITGPQAAVIAKDWYKGRKVEEVEMAESQFNSILNPKKSKRYEARVEFISEDAAYDAMGIWKNVLFPSIRPMSAFDPWTQKQLATARRLADVEVEKDGETLIVRSSSKSKGIEAVAIFNEDEDSVVSATKPKRISESDMSLEEALLILENSKMIPLSPEQIARRRWRAKVRRAQKKTPELMAKLEKMYDRVIDFDQALEAPWISRALANEDYESVQKEKDRINKLYQNEVAEPFDKMADDLYRAINHDKDCELFKLLSKMCRKLEGIQFFHHGACPETDEMRRINYV